MKQTRRSAHTFLRILSSYYVYTACTSYRLLLSIQAHGTNARLLVKFWFTEEPPSRSGIACANKKQLTIINNHQPFLITHRFLPRCWLKSLGLTNTDRRAYCKTHSHSRTLYKRRFGERMSFSTLDVLCCGDCREAVPTLIIYKPQWRPPRAMAPEPLEIAGGGRIA